MSEGEDEGYHLASIEDIKKCKLDIVAGEKSNSVWLVLDDSYALTKNKELKMAKVCGNVEEGGIMDVPSKWKSK